MITCLYYTANRINDRMAVPVREHLASHGLPIVSISHRPLKFGFNICVGNIPISPYSLYYQILLGARVADTYYVACCEDDTLYSDTHFMLRPPDNTFWYDTLRYWLDSPSRGAQRGAQFRFRDRAMMCTCIAPRLLLIEALQRRFAKYPECPPGRWAWSHFGEPGRVEPMLGLEPYNMARPKSHDGLVTINHRDSLGGKRKPMPNDIVTEEHPYWGKAQDMWEQYCA